MQPFLQALPVVATSALALVAFLTLVAAWLFLALRVRRNKHLLDALEKLPPGQRLKALQAEMGHVTPPKNFSAAQWLKWQTRRLYVYGGAVTVGVVAITLLAAYAFGQGHHSEPETTDPISPAPPATVKLIPSTPLTVAPPASCHACGVVLEIVQVYVQSDDAPDSRIDRHTDRQANAWRIVVRLDDGRYATVTQRENSGFRRGDYVEVSGDHLYRR